mgnify:CR=1 FL=1
MICTNDQFKTQISTSVIGMQPLPQNQQETEGVNDEDCPGTPNLTSSPFEGQNSGTTPYSPEAIWQTEVESTNAL